MAEAGDFPATGGTTGVTGRAETDGTALLPRSVRRWLLTGLGAVLALALYLIAVRGSAILFDLRDAVSALCF